jgi:hypothetical protein
MMIGLIVAFGVFVLAGLAAKLQRRRTIASGQAADEGIDRDPRQREISARLALWQQAKLEGGFH